MSSAVQAECLRADYSVFLAIKYAAPALSKICPEKGKHTPGGSLVLTASSKNVERIAESSL